MLLGTCATLAILSAPPAQCQDTIPSFSVTSEPSLLTEGTVGWIRVQPSVGATVSGGKAAGQPIHFERLADSGFRALVGVPIEVGDSLRISLILQHAERSDTIATALPVRQAGYPREQLAVAPAFVRPGKAAAARIRSDIAKGRQVSRLSQGRSRLWQGPFRLPRESRITSPYGTARVYNGQVKSRHLGPDFAGGVGAPVNSAGRGLVALVADMYLAGRAVYIDHGAGLVTAYFHLSRADVKLGDTVSAGQRIGAVGKTGRVTGPHLHWVARYGTFSVNPMSLLELEKYPPAPTGPDSSSSIGRGL